VSNPPPMCKSLWALTIPFLSALPHGSFIVLPTRFSLPPHRAFFCARQGAPPTCLHIPTTPCLRMQIGIVPLSPHIIASPPCCRDMRLPVLGRVLFRPYNLPISQTSIFFLPHSHCSSSSVDRQFFSTVSRDLLTSFLSGALSPRSLTVSRIFLHTEVTPSAVLRELSRS